MAAKCCPPIMPLETVATLFTKNQYRTDNLPLLAQLDAVKNAERKRLNGLVPNPQNANCGYFTPIRAVLQAEPKSRFEEFDFDVREGVYHSKRFEQLGMLRNCHTKPHNVNNVNRTFGIASHTNEPLYEIVLPSKVPKAEQAIWRHFDVCKKRYPYNDRFDADHMFGRRYGALDSGLCTRQCLEEKFSPAYKCVINDIQGMHRRRITVADGKSLEPLLEEFGLPADHVFGGRRRNAEDRLGACDHFIECQPCQLKKNVLVGLGHLNRQRLALKNKYPPINFVEVLAIARSFDPNNSGSLPSDVMYLMLTKQHIIVDPTKLETFLKFIRILDENGTIKYAPFIDLLNILCPYPLLEKIADIPSDHLRYETTYHALAADCHRPFVKNELPNCLVNDCDRTDMAALLNPGVCIRNGLWLKDYQRGRSKAVIRQIFTAAGYTFSDTEFEMHWLECCRASANPNGLVSVDSFKNVLDSKL